MVMQQCCGDHGIACNRYPHAVSPLPSRRSDLPEGQKRDLTLVIGCGFIGSRIVTELRQAGTPVTVLTRSQPADALVEELSADSLIVGDASDAATVAEALAGVSHVVFSAGGLLPAASERDPDLDEVLTLRPLLTVLDAIVERGGISFLYLSSGGTIYGEPTRVPVHESDPTQPRGSYGRLHLRCEEEVAKRCHENGLDARILRCATVYGEGQQPDRGQGVVTTFLSRIRRGEPIELFGDGGTIRDYVYVGDVADVVTALTGHEGGPLVVNVGSGEGTSLLEVLRLTEAEVGREAEVIRHGERGFDVHRIYLDVTSLRELIAFEPTPLARGITLTNQWLATLAAEPT
jgi:UDP-glucose 4-epimerase